MGAVETETVLPLLGFCSTNGGLASCVLLRVLVLDSFHVNIHLSISVDWSWFFRDISTSLVFDDSGMISVGRPLQESKVHSQYERSQ